MVLLEHDQFFLQPRQTHCQVILGKGQVSQHSSQADDISLRGLAHGNLAVIPAMQIQCFSPLRHGCVPDRFIRVISSSVEHLGQLSGTGGSLHPLKGIVNYILTVKSQYNYCNNHHTNVLIYSLHLQLFSRKRKVCSVSHIVLVKIVSDSTAIYWTEPENGDVNVTCHTCRSNEQAKDLHYFFSFFT